MHVRMNIMTGDPARLDEAARYLEGTVRPHVEAQHGSRGMAFLTNAELGTCVIASYWETAETMTASEHAVQVSRKEMTEMIGGTVSVEHFEVPVFTRRSRPERGAGVRLTRVEIMPGNLDAAIEEFRNTSVPALTDMGGLCSAQLMADRTTGRALVLTAWETMEALHASRAQAARLRADQIEMAHGQVRTVEEYTLMFSSAREGDTRSLIERDIELWNARDHDGFLASFDLHRLEVRAPGGIRMAGREAADALWSSWMDAFPDNRLGITAIHGDDRGGVHEGRFTGTHTGPLRSPAGEIAATGRAVDAPFCGIYEFEDGKITGLRLYFDQIELLTQLGIAPGGGT